MRGSSGGWLVRLRIAGPMTRAFGSIPRPAWASAIVASPSSTFRPQVTSRCFRPRGASSSPTMGRSTTTRSFADQLIAEGCEVEWRGHSDTETLLAGFDHWGVEADAQARERHVRSWIVGQAGAGADPRSRPAGGEAALLRAPPRRAVPVCLRAQGDAGISRLRSGSGSRSAGAVPALPRGSDAALHLSRHFEASRRLHRSRLRAERRSRRWRNTGREPRSRAQGSRPDREWPCRSGRPAGGNPRARNRPPDDGRCSIGRLPVRRRRFIGRRRDHAEAVEPADQDLHHRLS